MGRVRPSSRLIVSITPHTAETTFEVMTGQARYCELYKAVRKGPMLRHHRLMNITAGCVAVTNSELEAIWRAVPDGTPVEIMP